MSDHQYYMQQAIDLAHLHKTPYAALLLERSSGAYILEANSTKVDGRTAHAEMNVIRRREENQLFSDPADLILYTTGEPCPMCMGAIIWTGIPKIYYGVSITEIKNFHRQIIIPSAQIAENSWMEIEIHSNICYQACLKLFQEYGK
jgi:tRNA(Arg) A34 adenosine deaminase TadA